MRSVVLPSEIECASLDPLDEPGDVAGLRQGILPACAGDVDQHDRRPVAPGIGGGELCRRRGLGESLWSGVVSEETRRVQEVRRAVRALTGDDLCQQLADTRRVLETVTAVPAGHDDTGLGVQPADEELPVG